MLRLIIVAALLALSACSPASSPASAVPHGARPVMVDCPEVDPAQPRCRVSP